MIAIGMAEDDVQLLARDGRLFKESRKPSRLNLCTANRQLEKVSDPRASLFPNFPFYSGHTLSSPQLNSTRHPLLALSMKKSFASRRVPRKIGQDDQDALSGVSSNNG